MTASLLSVIAGVLEEAGIPYALVGPTRRFGNPDIAIYELPWSALTTR